MEKAQAEKWKEAVSALARIALYVADELEPTNSDVLARDLDDVYELLVAAERKARQEGHLTY